MTPWLTALSGGMAPPTGLVEWAGQQASFASAWGNCPRGDWLIWLASRGANTIEQQRAVVVAACTCARLADRSTVDLMLRLRPRPYELAAVWAGDQDEGTVLRTWAPRFYRSSLAAFVIAIPAYFLLSTRMTRIVLGLTVSGVYLASSFLTNVFWDVVYRRRLAVGRGWDPERALDAAYQAIAAATESSPENRKSDVRLVRGMLPAPS